MKKKSIPKVVYMVWQGGLEQNYFLVFESKEDALFNEGDGVEIFESKPKSLGKFKRSVKIVKSR